jgi:hypothetical protein
MIRLPPDEEQAGAHSREGSESSSGDMTRSSVSSDGGCSSVANGM